MLKRFLKDTGGQFAIMASLSAMAILVGVGAAIDYNAAVQHKAKLQNLTDSGALAAAITRSEKLSKLRKAAKKAIKTNNTTGEKVKVDVSLHDDIIRVSATMKYKTQLMGLIGKKTIEVNAVSESPLPKGFPINVALVLDRTGSMSGTKMTELKSAATGMMDIFAEFDSDIKAAVIPFSDYVNVGKSNRFAKWMDSPKDETIFHPKKCYMKKKLLSKSGCTTTQQKIFHPERTVYNDGVPIVKPAWTQVKNKETCSTYNYGPEYEHCYVPKSTYKWYGCAGSRGDGQHTNPRYDGKKIPGVMNIACGEELLPLTDNLINVKSKINSLSASRETYIPAGLIWGWRALDKKHPLNELTNGEAKRKRALILMTDGKNTKSLKGIYHNGTDATAADSLTRDLCTKIKDDNIDVYAVAYKFGSGDADAKQVVQDCATDKDFFFDAKDADELKAAFEDIAKSLFTVRLSG